MATQCIPEQLEFHALGRHQVVGRFDGGRITSDGGGVVLREVESRLGLMDRLAKCFVDCRDADLIEHDVRSLFGQRVYGVALGYEDLNDHDTLRADSLLALLVGKADVTGRDRLRERDNGYPLAGSSTLNRLELSRAETAPGSRYKRIVADSASIDRLLVDLFVEAHSRVAEEIWLDLDATDDPLHGQQEGRFFHGYYRCYCYLPLYIFCGEHLLCARLRPSTRIIIRADSGFCREPIMQWCEANGVDYVLGLARNSRLKRLIGKLMQEAKADHQDSGKAARRFCNFDYKTRKSWSRERRVVAKAEYLPGKENPRFVVTSLSTAHADAQHLYEVLYYIATSSKAPRVMPSM